MLNSVFVFRLVFLGCGFAFASYAFAQTSAKTATAPIQLECHFLNVKPSGRLNIVEADFAKERLQNYGQLSKDKAGSEGWREVFGQALKTELCKNGVHFYQVDWKCKRTVHGVQGSDESGKAYRVEDKNQVAFDFVDEPIGTEGFSHYKIDTDCTNHFTTILRQGGYGQVTTLLDLLSGAQFEYTNEAGAFSPDKKFLLAPTKGSETIEIFNCKNRSPSKGCVSAWASTEGKYNPNSVEEIRWKKDELSFEVSGNKPNTAKASEAEVETFKKYKVICKNFDHLQCKEVLISNTSKPSFEDGTELRMDYKFQA